MRAGPRIYNLFPLLAGSIPDWEKHLPRIAAMGFDWVYLNPFHYPGFSGSLYAVKEYDRLNPLFESGDDPPDAQLKRFLEQAEAHGLSVMMDLVINHTSKDSALASQHPEYFVRETDGSVRSPSATNPADASEVTVWGDLAEIDYSPRPEREALVATWRDLVRHYRALGFHGFRCDAAYKVPGEVWAQVIEAAREQGETLFSAETLGGRLEEVEQLHSAGFDYLFNSGMWWDFREDWLLEQYQTFRRIAPSIAFPESHDTPRLAATLAEKGIVDPKDLEAHYRLHYLFAAFFSSGVLMPIGFEFGFRRPLDVVETHPDHWEEPLFDLSGFITEANRMKAASPPLNQEGPQERLTDPANPVVALLRRMDEGEGWVLALIHPDRGDPAEVALQDLLQAAGLSTEGLREITPDRPGEGCDGDGNADMEPAGQAGPFQIRLDPVSMRLFEGGMAHPDAPSEAPPKEEGDTNTSSEG